MQVGVVFPQTEIGADPGAVRAYVQAAEDLGFSHLLVFDHVLGADTTHYQGWSGVYSSADMFHEPFVAFGYMSALTTRLELVTAVIIMGQRQTALLAKQGCGSGRAQRWEAAPRGGHWLEPRGVRGPGGELP